MKKALLALIAVLMLAAAGVGAWAAFGPDENESSIRGTCDNRHYELSVETDDGLREVSFELHATAPGERWTVLMAQGETTLLEGEWGTDEDAELDLDAVADPEGGDWFEVTVTPVEGGAAPCAISLTQR